MYSKLSNDGRDSENPRRSMHSFLNSHPLKSIVVVFLLWINFDSPARDPDSNFRDPDSNSTIERNYSWEVTLYFILTQEIRES